MFKFFKKPNKSKNLLALDIGTEFVKAIIVEISEEGGKPKIIGFGKYPQKLGDMHNGAIMDITSVIENSKEAILQAQENAGVDPSQIILGMAGELVKGDVTTVEFKRKHPDKKIDLDELQEIVQKVQREAFKTARQKIAEDTGFPELEIKLVNAAIVSVNIDGYKVTNPIGFQGENMKITIFNAFSPLVHFGSLQTIGQELGLDLLSIAVEPYAVSRSLSYEDGGDYSAIFIDIGGGTTDIAVVQNGACLGTKMFTLGGRSFTKRLSQILNISLKEAEDIKLAYSDDDLDRESTEKVREAFKVDSQVWVSGVELSLSEFDHLDSLPSKIYICGGGSHLPEIKEVLEDISWQKNLPFISPPKVSFLVPEYITNLEDKTNSLKDPSDITPMALANLGVPLSEQEDSIKTVLRKVIKLMQV